MPAGPDKGSTTTSDGAGPLSLAGGRCAARVGRSRHGRIDGVSGEPIVRVAPINGSEAFDLADRYRALDLHKAGIPPTAGLRAAGRPAFLIGCQTQVDAT